MFDTSPSPAVSGHSGIVPGVSSGRVSQARPVHGGLDPLLARFGGGIRRRVRRGEYLFHCGASFHALYGVRAGSFKSVLLTEDGREQVTGYHMAGEILGLESIGSELCSSDAIALEDSEVVEIPFAELDALARRDPALQRELFRLLAAEIQRERGLMLLLGSMRAEERLATFLLNLSKRLAARGWSATHFILRMTREEIGSYLGLKLETVSRTFSKFQDEGILEVKQRQIRVLDPAALQALVNSSSA